MWYQSFSMRADGTWDYEFHRQGREPHLIQRAYLAVDQRRFIMIPLTNVWHYDALNYFRPLSS